MLVASLLRENSPLAPHLRVALPQQSINVIWTTQIYWLIIMHRFFARLPSHSCLLPAACCLLSMVAAFAVALVLIVICIVQRGTCAQTSIMIVKAMHVAVALRRFGGRRAPLVTIWWSVKCDTLKWHICGGRSAWLQGALALRWKVCVVVCALAKSNCI